MSKHIRDGIAETTEVDYPAKTIRQIRQILLEWGRDNYQEYPWRAASCDWHALIAEVLLQRTRASSVAKVYDAFIGVYSLPIDLGNASLEHIQKTIYPLGLQWRAPLLKQLGMRIFDLKNRVPGELKELLSLPGVGPYAAASYLSFRANKRAVIVDANIVRWLCRMVDRPIHGETRRERWLLNLADQLTPGNKTRAYNYAALDFSMIICTSKPKCHICPIGPKYCMWRRKTLECVQKAPELIRSE